MAVYEDGIKCFGCGWYGGAQDFLKTYKKMDYGEIQDYLDLNGLVVSLDEDFKIQSKKQKELMNLTEVIKAKFPMCTDVVTGRAYVYYGKMNVWKDVTEESFFFRQLLSEELGIVPLQDDLEVIKQYVLNPRREDDGWIGFKNGLVNSETGEFIHPTPDIYTTTWLQYNYDSKAYSGFMDRILKDVLCDEDDSKYHFFFELVGYLFTDHNRYNKMFFLTGSGGNGKSTLMGILRKIFEGYTTAVPLQDLNKPFGLQPLLGKKVNIVYDLSSKAIKDMGVIKAITGEDEVAIDRKYESTITTKLGTKILATGNVLPKVSEETYAFFRRVVHLELKNTFKQDQSIPIKIQEDKDGLEWVIYKSIQAYQDVKEKGWSIDENISSVADSYIRLSDPLGWVCEQIFIEADEEDFMSREQVYHAMKEHLEENEMAVPRKKSVFYDAIREFGGVDTRRSIQDTQKRGFCCIRHKFITPDLFSLKGWD
ncbi:MAG: phage/plasmid primase, P4 family [Methanobacterium paludis]|nr:phage/plasmid primase, P4 family [Methanobacterium paludis]